MQLLQWLFGAKVGQEREEISSSSNKNATTNDQEAKPNYIILFRRGSVGVYQKSSKGVEESKSGSKKFKPFTFLCRKVVATPCFNSTLQLKRLNSINRRQARQHWIQSMKIMKKEDIAKGLGISSTKADSVNVSNKVLPVNDSTLSTLTSTNEQCGLPEKKEQLKGDKTKTLSRMKELLRWAAAAKSDKGGKFIARKVKQFRNRGTLKAVPDDDQLSNDSPKISFRWDLESNSTTSSAYTALSTASSLKNDQIISLPSLNSTKFQDPDHLEPKKGNWITSDSEFVVLEL
ncbi:uncharacterized protein LOC103960559 [Pyrus x bretschneideri]|uniref:uncharacterized protein LOC103960559 n=1 Tax=Pyrus x bretschneideri TaxID=225117 RepID=UPI00202F8B5B|nr:uncharacterized protein LOC103960559 [Pyrus x bretschneideri]